MKVSQGLMLSSMLAFVFTFSGCPAEEETDGTENGGGSSVTSNDNGGEENGHTDEGHDHGDPPHDGVVIELGSDYHGEFVHDEDSVSIYILDAGVTNQVAIAAEMLTLNVTPEGGEPKQYELAADPDEGDEDGMSSRFTLTDAELVEALEKAGRSARVSVVIDDNPYSGDIPEHSHD